MTKALTKRLDESMYGLNEKQQRFVAAMLTENSARAAYVKAGYKVRGAAADANASRLLRNDKVRAALAQERAKRAQRTQVTQDKVLKELARVAFTDMRSYAKWGPEGVSLKSSSELTEDDTAAVTEVSESYGENGRTLKFKLGHKDSALKMLADHVGLFDKGQGKEGDEFDRLLEAINSGEPNEAEED